MSFDFLSDAEVERLDGRLVAEVEPQGDCLLWTGSKNGNGYGQAKSARRTFPMHRYAWMRANGPIPAGALVDHACWNRACVNPYHLRLSTRQSNGMNRRGAAGRSATGVRNVRRHRDKFQVNIKKDGRDMCFGTFSTMEEAARVAKKKRTELFGEYAGGSR